MTLPDVEKRFRMRVRTLAAEFDYELPSEHADNAVDAFWTTEDIVIHNIVSKIVRQERILARLFRKQAEVLQKYATDLEYDGHCGSIAALDSSALEYGLTQIQSYRRMLMSVIESFKTLEKDTNF